MKKKIVILYPYNTGEKAFSGGVPKVAISNIIAVQNSGYVPYLVLPLENQGLITFVNEHHPYCNVIPVNFRSLSLFSDTKGIKRYINIIKNIIGYYRGKRELKKAIRSIAPDIIHFHEIINFPLLNVFSNAKIILHLHSYRFTGYEKMLQIILKRVNKHCDFIISPTKSILEALGNSIKVPSLVIDTPYLELQETLLSEDNKALKDELISLKTNDKVIFSFVGRICSIKRIDHFIEAIHNIDHASKSKIIFSIIGGTNTSGDIEYKKYLTSKIKEFGLENVVRFYGYVNPIEIILPFVDYGVILSESEAVPMIGIEYMRFNIPIIGYNAPGISDFLINNKNGYLLENGEVQNLTQKLKDILNDNKRNMDFEESIPEIFKRHTIVEFTKAIRNLYIQL